jgi:uroporphyrinogen decarboxylase
VNKLPRVKAALQGATVDRPPYGFWTHLPGIDHDPVRLADETARFCARYDLDFVKSMPNGLYCVEDWGCVCDFSDIERGGVARVVEAAVNSEHDWEALQRVDVTRGAFGRELQHLASVVQQVGPDVAVLATVFSPLTIAGKLSNGLSRAHTVSDPCAIERGLAVITEVTCAFTREALARGCAGVFLALQEATSTTFDERSYRRFGEPYDRRVLDTASAHGGWFNVVHAHGEDILFEIVRDYEVSALNWHIGETAPSVAQYRASGGSKPILGGLRRTHITRGDRAAIAQDITDAVSQNAGGGLLLAPACVIRHPVDPDTLAWTADRIRALAQN